MKKNLRHIIKKAGLPTLFTLVCIVFLVVLLLFKIESLVPGWSAAELATRANSLNHHRIIANPINAPYTVLVYGLLKLLPKSVLAVRLVSAAYGALTILLFMYIVRCWHSLRIALLSGLLFATSTWFLRASRLGTPDILLFGLLCLTALGLWLQRTKHSRVVLFCVTLLLAISLYIPGFIWFIAVALYWQRKVIAASLRQVPAWLGAVSVLAVLILFVPLGWGIAHHWQLVWAVFGLPAHLPRVLTVLKHLADVPINLFIRGPLLPGLWVGRSPVLDVFETCLFLVGVYAYWQHRRLARVGSLFSIFVITSVLVALGGPVSLSLLVPFVYLVIATGLAFLLGEWLSVFPRNPIARGLGLVVVVIAVLVSCSYQLNRYFIAWPHQPATKAVFSLHPPQS